MKCLNDQALFKQMSEALESILASKELGKINRVLSTKGPILRGPDGFEVIGLIL